MEITEKLLTLWQGARPGNKITPIALVIHYTANENKGANAIANRNYFENWRDHLSHLASAHYIVDDKQIIRCIPENEVAYHVGATAYKPEAIKAFGTGNPNLKTLGIEMCVNSDGDFSKTYKNTVELAADILKRHGWGVDRLWRHYDVTGKICPGYFVDDTIAVNYGFASAVAGWEMFRWDVAQRMKDVVIIPVEEKKILVKVGDTVIEGKMFDEKVYAPVRDLLVALERKISWDDPNKTVIIE